MPDNDRSETQRQVEESPGLTDQYRVTYLRGDTAEPPAQSGDVVLQTWHSTLEAKDSGIQAYRELAGDDVGRILVEVRHKPDLQQADRGDRWTVVQAWTRTAEGWDHD